MSGVSLPVTRPIGRALVVGSPSSRPQPLSILERIGYTCGEADNPYAAMMELCRKSHSYGAMILSLASLFKEELSLIESVKHRFPNMEIWLTHTDGRQASLAEAMRLGADGLLAEDGLHRMAISATAAQDNSSERGARPVADMPPGEAVSENLDRDLCVGEPVLTADELRALLQEQPSLPPSSGE